MLYIAVLLSGRITTSSLNTMVSNFRNFKESLKGHKIVYFISLNKNANDSQYTDNFCENLQIDKEDCLLISECLVPDIIEEDNWHETIRPKNIWSMFYNNNLAFTLMEKYQVKHNIKFNVIIKYRGDIKSDSKLNVLESINSYTVYIPSGNDYRDGINDQIALGDYTSMKKYCRCIDSIIPMLKKGCILHPETLLKKYLIESKLHISRFSYGYNIFR